MHFLETESTGAVFRWALQMVVQTLRISYRLPATIVAISVSLREEQWFEEKWRARNKPKVNVRFQDFTAAKRPYSLSRIDLLLPSPIEPGLASAWQLCFSGVFGVGYLRSEYGVEGDEELSGGSDEGDLGRFSSGTQAVVKGGHGSFAADQAN